MIVKIGVSNNPYKRLKTIEGHNPRIFEFLGYIGPIDSQKEAFRVEKIFHKRYNDKRIRGEWFNLDKDDLPTISSDEWPTDSTKFYIYFIAELSDIVIGRFTLRKKGIKGVDYQ